MAQTANVQIHIFQPAPALELDRQNFCIPAHLGFRMVLEALAGLIVLIAVSIAILD